MTRARRRDLVRGYMLTRGRARGRNRLDVVTLVTASRSPAASSAVLQPEEQQVLRLCRDGWLSVAEIAGHLGLPLTITGVLLSDLIDSGHLTARATSPPPLAGHPSDDAAAGHGFVIPDTDTLERLLHGLRAL